MPCGLIRHSGLKRHVASWRSCSRSRHAICLFKVRLSWRCLHSAADVSCSMESVIFIGFVMYRAWTAVPLYITLHAPHTHRTIEDTFTDTHSFARMTALYGHSRMHAYRLYPLLSLFIYNNQSHCRQCSVCIVSVSSESIMIIAGLQSSLLNRRSGLSGSPSRAVLPSCLLIVDLAARISSLPRRCSWLAIRVRGRPRRVFSDSYRSKTGSLVEARGLEERRALDFTPLARPAQR